MFFFSKIKNASVIEWFFTKVEFTLSFVGCLVNIRRWAMFALLAVRIQRRLERTLELDRLEPLGPIKPGSDGQHQQHHQQHDHIFINKNNTKNTINSTKSSSTWPPALEALGPLPPVEPASSTLNSKSVSLAVLPVALVETPTAKGALDVIVHRMGWWMIAIKMMRWWLFGENKGRIMLPMQHSVETLNKPHSFTFSSRYAKQTTRAF